MLRSKTALPPALVAEAAGNRADALVPYLSPKRGYAVRARALQAVMHIAGQVYKRDYYKDDRSAVDAVADILFSELRANPVPRDRWSMPKGPRKTYYDTLAEARELLCGDDDDYGRRRGLYTPYTVPKILDVFAGDYWGTKPLIQTLAFGNRPFGLDSLKLCLALLRNFSPIVESRSLGNDDYHAALTKCAGEIFWGIGWVRRPPIKDPGFAEIQEFSSFSAALARQNPAAPADFIARWQLRLLRSLAEADKTAPSRVLDAFRAEVLAQYGLTPAAVSALPALTQEQTLARFCIDLYVSLAVDKQSSLLLSSCFYDLVKMDFCGSRELPDGGKERIVIPETAELEEYRLQRLMELTLADPDKFGEDILFRIWQLEGPQSLLRFFDRHYRKTGDIALTKSIALMLMLRNQNFAVDVMKIPESFLRSLSPQVKSILDTVTWEVFAHAVETVGVLEKMESVCRRLPAGTKPVVVMNMNGGYWYTAALAEKDPQTEKYFLKEPYARRLGFDRVEVVQMKIGSTPYHQDNARLVFNPALLGKEENLSGRMSREDFDRLMAPGLFPLVVDATTGQGAAIPDSTRGYRNLAVLKYALGAAAALGLPACGFDDLFEGRVRLNMDEGSRDPALAFVPTGDGIWVSADAAQAADDPQAYADPGIEIRIDRPDGGVSVLRVSRAKAAQLLCVENLDLDSGGQVFLDGRHGGPYRIPVRAGFSGDALFCCIQAASSRLPRPFDFLRPPHAQKMILDDMLDHSAGAKPEERMREIGGKMERIFPLIHGAHLAARRAAASASPQMLFVLDMDHTLIDDGRPLDDPEILETLASLLWNGHLVAVVSLNTTQAVQANILEPLMAYMAAQPYAQAFPGRLEAVRKNFAIGSAEWNPDKVKSRILAGLFPEGALRRMGVAGVVIVGDNDLGRTPVDEEMLNAYSPDFADFIPVGSSADTQIFFKFFLRTLGLSAPDEYSSALLSRAA